MFAEEPKDAQRSVEVAANGDGEEEMDLISWDGMDDRDCTATLKTVCDTFSIWEGSIDDGYYIYETRVELDCVESLEGGGSSKNELYQSFSTLNALGIILRKPIPLDVLSTSSDLYLSDSCMHMTLAFVGKQSVIPAEHMIHMQRFHRAMCCLEDVDFVDTDDFIPVGTQQEVKVMKATARLMDDKEWIRSSNGAWYVLFPINREPATAAPADRIYDPDYIQRCAGEAQLLVHNMRIVGDTPTAKPIAIPAEESCSQIPPDAWKELLVLANGISLCCVAEDTPQNRRTLKDIVRRVPIPPLATDPATGENFTFTEDAVIIIGPDLVAEIVGKEEPVVEVTYAEHMLEKRPYLTDAIHRYLQDPEHRLLAANQISTKTAHTLLLTPISVHARENPDWLKRNSVHSVKVERLHFLAEQCRPLGLQRWYFLHRLLPSVMHRIQSWHLAFEARGLMTERIAAWYAPVSANLAALQMTAAPAAEKKDDMEICTTEAAAVSANGCAEITQNQGDGKHRARDAAVHCEQGLLEEKDDHMVTSESEGGDPLPPTCFPITAAIPATPVTKTAERTSQIASTARRDYSGIPSLKLMLEAMTPRMVAESFDSERLEMLGDAFLKYVITVQLYKTCPEMREGSLTTTRSVYINNRKQCEVCFSTGMAKYLRAIALSRGERVVTVCPPGMPPADSMEMCSTWGTDIMATPARRKFNPDELFHFCKPLHERRTVMFKKFADMVESVIGAYYVHAGEQAGIDAVKAFGLWPGEEAHTIYATLSAANSGSPFSLSSSAGSKDSVPAHMPLHTESAFHKRFGDHPLLAVAVTLPPRNSEAQRAKKRPLPVSLDTGMAAEKNDFCSIGGGSVTLNSRRTAPTLDLAELEANLKYQFKDRRLLRLALTHSSVSSTFNAERLEFLGDAVLDFVTIAYWFRNHDEFEPVHLNDAKSKNTCNRNLASKAYALGLHKFVQHNCDHLHAQLQQYCANHLAHDQARSSPDVSGSIAAPVDGEIADGMTTTSGVLADTMEAVIGAIFLDCGEDSSVIERFAAENNLLAL